MGNIIDTTVSLAALRRHHLEPVQTLSMANASENVTDVAVAHPPSHDAVSADTQSFLQPPAASPGGRVYIDVARTSLSRWLQICGPAPWLVDASRETSTFHRPATRQYREQAAALAIAMLSELDRDRPDREYLREVARTSLVRWQLSLRGDGVPVARSERGSPLHACTLWCIVQLLSETAGFQTGLLLDDVERHLRWVMKRTAGAPWIEAAAICTMADCAVLLRDSNLLDRARDRLVALLARQDQEGWFPERGGADVGRLSLTIDALARVYRQSGWAELAEPLRRALSFLIHFAHPDGTVGGCYDSCGAGFLAPYGVELLTPSIEEAASLALLTRKWSERCAAQRPDHWPDGQFAAWGASLMLAAANAASDLPARGSYPCDVLGRNRFPHAGLSVFTNRTYHAVVGGKKGGALRVTWRNGTADLDDPGIVVTFPHSTRVAGRPEDRTVEQVTDTMVTSDGILRRSEPVSERPRHWLKRITGWIRRRQSTPSVPAPKPDHPHHVDYRRLTHDRYTRRIIFGDDWISIRDRVDCRLPCRTVICQSPPPTVSGPFGDTATPGTGARPPIFVEGGRHVEITRLYQNGELIDPRLQPQPAPIAE